jgi:expansin (peptidoglycan-binding protein)
MLKLDGFDDAFIGIATVWQKAESGGARLVDTLIYDGAR